MEELVLRAGEQSTVTLPGLGTAGYRWSATVNNPDIVRVARVIATPAAGDIQPGRSLDERFLLTALASGETSVRFARPGRSNRPDRLWPHDRSGSWSPFGRKHRAETNTRFTCTRSRPHDIESRSQM